jgi:hypothetical protein
MIKVEPITLDAKAVALAAADLEIGIALDVIEAARRNLMLAGRIDAANKLAVARLHIEASHRAAGLDLEQAGRRADDAMQATSDGSAPW